MFPDWHWQILTMPPRHFSWRVRGNPLFWSVAEAAVLAGEYDLLIATSMVDLATLRGLVPKLATLPTVLYFHENQFDYPRAPAGTKGRGPQALLEAQMVSLYSAMAADRVVFNSRYNQEGFFSGSDALLNKLPDKVPTGIVQALRRKAIVIPVPLSPVSEPVRADASVWGAQQAQMPRRDLRLLWVGRFEYDKGGEQLLLCLRALESRGLCYQLAVVGQQFRSSPAAFSTIENEFQHRLVQFGYLESRRQYLATLAAADIVLSTALHEFQGLAVLEAVAAGALPAVPADLVYPEILPARNCYRTYPDEPGRQAGAAADLIVDLAGQLEEGVADLPDVTRFSTVSLAPQYRELFHCLAERRQ